jgi:hypothetical protein
MQPSPRTSLGDILCMFKLNFILLDVFLLLALDSVIKRLIGSSTRPLRSLGSYHGK